MRNSCDNEGNILPAREGRAKGGLLVALLLEELDKEKQLHGCRSKSHI
jgi:hypothetical protein